MEVQCRRRPHRAALRNFWGAERQHGNGPVKPGAYLVRKSDASLPSLQDLLVITTLQSAPAAGAVGLVFRWQNADNFYFFLMDGQRNYRRLGKKVGGVFKELGTPAADLTHGYVAGQAIAVRVRARKELQAYLDGYLVPLAEKTASMSNRWRVGFYTWKNNGAVFDELQVVEL